MGRSLFLAFLGVLLCVSVCGSARAASTLCVPRGKNATVLETSRTQLGAGEIAAAAKTLEDALKPAKTSGGASKPAKADLSVIRLRLQRLEVLWHLEGATYPQADAEKIIAQSEKCDPETRSYAAVESLRLSLVRSEAEKTLSQKDLEEVRKTLENTRNEEGASPRAIAAALALAGQIAFRAGSKDEGLKLGLDAVKQWEKAAPNGHYLRWVAGAAAADSLANGDKSSYRTDIAKRLAKSSPPWTQDTPAPPGGMRADIALSLLQMAFLRLVFEDGVQTAAGFKPLVFGYYQPPRHPLQRSTAALLCEREITARYARDRATTPLGYESVSAGSRACLSLIAWSAAMQAHLLDEIWKPLEDGDPKKTEIGKAEDKLWQYSALTVGTLAFVGARTLRPDLVRLAKDEAMALANLIRMPFNFNAARAAERSILFVGTKAYSCDGATALFEEIQRTDQLQKDAAIFGEDKTASVPDPANDEIDDWYFATCVRASLVSVRRRGKWNRDFLMASIPEQVAWTSPGGTFNAESLRSFDPRRRSAPADAEFAQLTDTIDWVRMITWAKASGEDLRTAGREALIWIFDHDLFGGLPPQKVFEACAARYELTPPSVSTEQQRAPSRIGRCKQVFEDPSQWSPFYTDDDLGAVFAAVKSPSELLSSYEDVVRRRVERVADAHSVMSVLDASQPIFKLDGILSALRSSPGSVDRSSAKSIGTILLQFGGIDDDIARATARGSSPRPGTSSASKLQEELKSTADELVQATQANDKAATEKVLARRRDLQLDLFKSQAASRWLRVHRDAKFEHLCRPETHVVAYFEALGELHAIVEGPDCVPRYVSLGALEPLETLAKQVARLREDEARWPGLSLKETLLSTSAELRRRLWTPLGIPTGGTVAISDSRFTSQVLFAALAGLRKNTFLAEDHVLIRGYALGDFWPRAPGSADRQMALSVLGTVSPRDKVDSEATEEGFRRMMPGAVSLAGSNASLAAVEKELKKAGARYISFTAHGRYNAKASAKNEVPVREAVWTQTEIELGGKRASALELLTLPLDKTDVVFLGACESGTGPEGADGVTTLRRAMRLAGARSVVSSIGLVNQGAARRMSSLFWAEIVSGRAPAVALANAQRRRLAELRQAKELWYSPPQWAVFEITTSLPPK